MLSTYMSYQLITRDIDKSINRIEKQPLVDRETKYFLDNITKVTSIDDFVNDTRLFKYAMKAFGLGDMDYAKAFMKKALKEGVSDPNSFANKLTDKRYAEFVRAFNFADYGAAATSYNPAQQGVTNNYLLQVEVGALQTGLNYDRGETFNFLAKIGNVKSIDDLMADKRLLSYAMAAYGLDADKESPDTVRQMLEGGVSDPQSPANKLYDKSYANFVSAFDFAQYGDQTTSRAAVLSQTPQAYLAASGLTSLNAGSAADQAEVDYFNANIGKVTSISDLMSDKRLLTFAMAAFGLDAKTEPSATVRAMLAGGVSDPASPANQLSDKRYAAFVRAFDFAQYGSATTTRDAVTQAVPALYLQSSDPENAYFRANIGKVKSVNDLLSDKRLLSYAMSAYGLDAKTVSVDRVRTMLTGGVSDPYSPANLSSDKRYAAFVSAFDFNTYGDATTSRAEVLDQTPRYHVENANPETAYFRANIAKVRSASGLMSDDRLLTYAMAAFGLDASAEDPAKVKAMLEGGVSDPQSPANRSGDPRYLAFVAAFDFQQYGTQTTSRSQVLDATPSSYATMDGLGLVKPPASYVQAESDYYQAAVAKMTSIDDLMANKRVLNYALSAFGLDPKTEDPARIRLMLEGGVRDPDSPVNKLGDKNYMAFVAAFNFEQYGEDATTYRPSQQPVVDKYMRQTLEEDAGQSNEGVRLALYFQRKASTLTNWYEVLADKALASVVRTAFGLPESFASADIDKQVKLFEQRMDIADFADPQKLGKFINRFTTLYEIQNPTSTALTSVSVLFAQPTEIGVSTDLLMAMQQLKPI
ncbi:DUF1217 domain-containing protein [Mesorhizobium sp. PUT5]|uniref:DUF1217 domain-containing protein n=1 Tax=Mesorhizobium sp. PUT5 TaxID=3454629 RepID=UPI003FA4B16E